MKNSSPECYVANGVLSLLRTWKRDWDLRMGSRPFQLTDADIDCLDKTAKELWHFWHLFEPHATTSPTTHDDDIAIPSRPINRPPL